jgi:hypothetical protein
MPGKDLVLRPAEVAVQPSAVMPFPQQSKRESESAAFAIAKWARRNSHATIPMAIPPALWLGGLVLHQTHTVVYALLCGALLSACVWFFAPHKWTDKAGEPKMREVWYARLSAVLGSGWLIAAAALGPLAGFVAPIVLASVLVAGTGAWGFFWWKHHRPRGMKKRARLIAQCDAWWLSHCHHWNLHGSHVIDAELKGVTLRMRIQGIGGRHSLQQFRQVLHLIESAAEGQADIGRVRLQAVKGHPSQVDLFLKQENPLRDVVEYDMSIAPQSVHDPAPFGKLETSSWQMIDMRKNRFTVGMTRWGKSNDLLTGLANMSGCPDARPVIIDLKGGRSARPVLKAGAAEYVITEIDEARMFLRMTVAEIMARAMYAYDGNEQLMATTAIPAFFVLVDETHDLTSATSGDGECTRLAAKVASKGSGLEVYLWIYTQHGSLEESVGTEQIRANLPMRTCYRVAEARHGAYVIPEYHLLDASKLEEKGTCYLKDGPDAIAEQIRTPLMEHEMLTRIAGQNVALLGERAPLHLYCGEEVAYQDGDRAVTWQEWWDTRWLRLHKAFRNDSPQYQAAIAEGGFVAAEVPAASQRATAPVPAHSPGTGDGAQAAARIASEDADLMSRLPDDFTPSPELVARLPFVVATQEDLFAEALQAAAADSPATPKDLGVTSGRGRTWCHTQLGALAEIGYVTQVSRGQYIPVPGMSIRQGMREIKDRNAKLAREARDKINAA